jgi:hypothetical protein
MPFQFTCPQGHLLEAEPFQAGQQCVCPMCGQPFLIPSPVGAVAPTQGGPAMYGSTSALPDSAAREEQPAPQPEPQAAPQASAEPTGADAAAGLPFVTQNTADLPLLHIPCPKGHELEVPRDMLNQFVECPQCQAQFTLRERDSVEYRKKHSAEMERRWEQTGQAWLQWAIIFAVLVVIGLITLIALS